MKKRGFRYKTTMARVLTYFGFEDRELILIPGVKQFALNVARDFGTGDPHQGEWMITHLQSGRRLPWVFCDRRAAMHCARDFDAHDWSEYAKQYVRMRDLGRSIGTKYKGAGACVLTQDITMGDVLRHPRSRI